MSGEMTQNGQEYAATKVAGSVTERSMDSFSDSPTEVVERAAAMLDGLDFFPDDWRDRIDLDTLDIDVACKCVVGQSMADTRLPYNTFVEKAGRRLDLGLLPAFVDNEKFVAAWKAYITATRGQANTETSSDLGAKPNNPTSPPTTNDRCGQTRTRSPEVLERVTANV